MLCTDKQRKRNASNELKQVRNINLKTFEIFTTDLITTKACGSDMAHQYTFNQLYNMQKTNYRITTLHLASVFYIMSIKQTLSEF